MKKSFCTLYIVLCHLVPLSLVLVSCHRTEERVLLPAGETLASVEDTLLWGYVDNEGEWAIPPMFDDAVPFTPDGFACVTYQGRLCWVDTKGGLHYAPDTLSWHDGFYNGYAHIGVLDAYGEFNLYGVIDTTFQYVVPPVNDNVEGYEYEPVWYDDNYYMNVGEWYCTADFDTVTHVSTFRWHTPDSTVIYEWQWPF